MEKQDFFYLKINRGQSTVEYVLLLLVVSTLFLSFYNSRAFRRYLGKDSEFFTQIANNIKYSYRHGRSGSEDKSNYSNVHESFALDSSRSRFFSSKDSYK